MYEYYSILRKYSSIGPHTLWIRRKLKQHNILEQKMGEEIRQRPMSEATFHSRK
jgi:hypothetical protein